VRTSDPVLLVTAEAFCITMVDVDALLVTLWIVIAEPVVPPVRP
jgi:hypothetical protein